MMPYSDFRATLNVPVEKKSSRADVAKQRISAHFSQWGFVGSLRFKEALRAVLTDFEKRFRVAVLQNQKLIE